jgi:hypothetical protein
LGENKLALFNINRLKRTSKQRSEKWTTKQHSGRMGRKDKEKTHYQEPTRRSAWLATPEAATNSPLPPGTLSPTANETPPPPLSPIVPITANVGSSAAAALLSKSQVHVEDEYFEEPRM